MIIIDVQQGLFNKPTPIYKADQLIENLLTLIERAHNLKVPVIYVQHSDARNLVKGTPEWDFHPALQPMKLDDRVHKLHPDAFEDTSLEKILEGHQVGHLVMGGLVTHGCVKSTCLGALARGYQVTLASDAHSNFSQDATKQIEKWNRELAARGAILKTTNEIVFDTRQEA